MPTCSSVVSPTSASPHDCPANVGGYIHNPRQGHAPVCREKVGFRETRLFAGSRFLPQREYPPSNPSWGQRVQPHCGRRGSGPAQPASRPADGRPLLSISILSVMEQQLPALPAAMHSFVCKSGHLGTSCLPHTQSLRMQYRLSALSNSNVGLCKGLHAGGSMRDAGAVQLMDV